MGNLMPGSKIVKEEWKEICSKDGITISKRQSPSEEVIIRRIDVVIRCPGERIAKNSMDL